VIAKHEMAINHEGRYQTYYAPKQNPEGLLECGCLLPDMKTLISHS